MRGYHCHLEVAKQGSEEHLDILTATATKSAPGKDFGPTGAPGSNERRTTKQLR